MTIARDYLAIVYPQWIKKVANPRLNLAQDSTQWEEFKVHMISQVTTKAAQFKN
jgi:hypothetical protein